MTMLDKAAVNYRVILTKTDKLGGGGIRQVEAAVTEALKKHPAAVPVPLSTSSEKGLGIEELRAELASFAEPG